MKESVFTTFKVWDNIGGKKLSKKEILNLAHDHFMDIQQTFGLSDDSCVRQIDLLQDDELNVYVFEIRYSNNLILVH